MSSGELDWNDDTRADWVAVLDAIHREMIPERYSEWREENRRWIEGLAEHVRSVLDEDPSPESLAGVRQQAEDARKKLGDTLDEAEESYLEKLPATTCKHSTHEPREELFEVEQEVIPPLWDELVREPMLAYFDEQIEAAFDS